MVSDPLYSALSLMIHSPSLDLRLFNKQFRQKSAVGWPAKLGALVAWMARFSRQSAALEETIAKALAHAHPLPHTDRAIAETSLAISHAHIPARAAMWSRSLERLRTVQEHLDELEGDPLCTLLEARRDGLSINVLQGLHQYTTARDLSGVLLDKLQHADLDLIAERNLEFHFGSELATDHPLFGAEFRDITRDELVDLSTRAALSYWELSVLTESQDDIQFARGQALSLIRAHGPSDPSMIFDESRIVSWLNLVATLPVAEIPEVVATLKDGLSAINRRFTTQQKLHRRAVEQFPNAHMSIASRTEVLGKRTEKEFGNALDIWLRATYFGASTAAGLAEDLESATAYYRQGSAGLGSAEAWPAILIVLATANQLRVQRRGGGPGSEKTAELFRLGLTKEMATTGNFSATGVLWPVRDVVSGLELRNAMDFARHPRAAASRASVIDDLLRGSDRGGSATLAARLSGFEEIGEFTTQLRNTNPFERLTDELRLLSGQTAILPTGDESGFAFITVGADQETPSVAVADASRIYETQERLGVALRDAHGASETTAASADLALVDAGKEAFAALPDAVQDALTAATTLHIIPATIAGSTGLLFDHPELLHDGKLFLGERAIVARTSSIRALSECLVGSVTTGSGESSLVLQTEEHEGSDLAWISAEVAEVKARLVRVGLGSQSTERTTIDRAFFEKHLASARMLHIAGHGKSDRLGGWLSLPGGYRLTPDEVRKWSTTAPPFVFFNTCELATQSQLGTVIQAGFASVFAGIGTRAFVGHVRRIPDKSAAALAASFYGAIAEGKSVGEALGHARRESGVRSCYSACCVLYGDPDVHVAEPYGGERSAEIAAQVASSIPAMWSDEELRASSLCTFPSTAKDIETAVALVRDIRVGRDYKNRLSTLIEVLVDPLLRASVLTALAVASHKKALQSGRDLDETWNLILEAVSSAERLEPSRRSLVPHADELRSFADELLEA